MPNRYRKLALLSLSYVFYGIWSVKFLSLILVSTFVDYACGLQLQKEGFSQRKRKIILSISIFTNLGILGFFKYYDFFVTSFKSAIELIFNLSVPLETLDLILPLGISFYTFQTLSYTIDVFRKKIPAERDLTTFALFVIFFPQLVAGPIEKAGHLIPQIRSFRFPPAQYIKEGFVLLGLGYFKKVVLGDSLAPMVDESFDNWESLDSFSLFEGMYLYYFQIYFDFSGYTDIARGLARFFGVKLLSNFERPYFSSSISEFWKRWHITFQVWLKEYLYIPLGGNRVSGIRQYLNVLITLTIGGLWHGATLNLALFGAIHGLYICIHRVILKTTSGLQGKCPRWISILITQIVILLTLTLFRAPDINVAFGYLASAFSFTGPIAVNALPFAVLIFSIFFIIDFLSYKYGEFFILRLPWSVQIPLLFTVITVVGFFMFDQPERPFIYFQF